MYRPMKIFAFAVDPLSPKPVVLLKDDDDVTIPIWIGTGEAVFMAAEFLNREINKGNDRKDLLTGLMGSMNLAISSITFDTLDNGAISAAVRFIRRKKEIKVDVRICDALITSLRTRLPLLVSDELAALLQSADDGACREIDARRYADFLENLDPAQMGKYAM